MNLTYGVRESRPLWKTELLCWATTVAGALLVLVAASALVAGGGVGRWIADRLGMRAAPLSVMHWLRWPVLGLTFMAATGLAYRVLPDVKQRFRNVALGAVLGALTWVLATWGFGLYVASFEHYDVTYGSLGGLVVLLTWLYLSGFVALAAGELNALVETRSGWRRAWIHGPQEVAGGERRA